ncbi:MAG: nucleotide exchange factor GrpE [Phycisphaeraceae bacterium]|nr:nucleotide exchange factor GrpE [Phycisphaeraceae bacterium]
MANHEHETVDRDQNNDGPPATFGDIIRDESGNLDASDAQAFFEKLSSDFEEMESRWKRSLADFQNFQRRAAGNEVEARARGVRDVCESMLGALDSLDMALSQDPASITPEQMFQAIGTIRAEAMKAMARHGVVPIEPEVGEAFNPGRHEAVMQQPAEGVGPGCVSRVFQSGYAMGERVLRPAKVAVAPAEG